MPLHTTTDPAKRAEHVAWREQRLAQGSYRAVYERGFLWHEWVPAPWPDIWLDAYEESLRLFVESEQP